MGHIIPQEYSHQIQTRKLRQIGSFFPINGLQTERERTREREREKPCRSKPFMISPSFAVYGLYCALYSSFEQSSLNTVVGDDEKLLLIFF